MDKLMWVGFALKVVLNLITHRHRFQKEIPEAVVACRVAIEETLQCLDGGLAEAEVERIRKKLQDAFEQIEDVFELLGDIVPLPK